MAPSAAPGADQGVQLIDEQDDVAAGPDLLEHLLEALLEIAAVAGAGHQGAEVQGVELLALDGLGHVAGHDLLGEALDDGGLADAGLADQNRIVLGPPGQDLHDPLDLAVPADDRVELALAGQLGQVAAELVEHRRARWAPPGRRRAGTGGRALLAAGRLVAGQELDDLLADPGQVGTQADQHLGGHALALADQAEEHVLGTDVVVAELQRLAQRQLQDLLGPGGEGRGSGGRRTGRADRLLDLLANRLEADTERLERLGRHALTLVDEAQQDVLSADEVVVEKSRFFLGQDQDSSGSVSETFEHAGPP